MRRVGIVIPAVNSVIEPELYGSRTSGVSFHFSRAHIGADTEDDLSVFRSEFPRCARELLAADVDCVILACASASLSVHSDEDLRLCMQVRSLGISTVFTAAQAMACELHSMNAVNVALVAPYPDWLMHSARRYYAECGITVVNFANMERDPVDQAAITEDELRALVRGVDSEDIEGILLSCTNMPTLSLLGGLRRDLGKPVVSSNDAILSASSGRL